ncbi:MAG: STAS domain-containing protein, partial [Candidatus Rokuibacteriota bacterium]
MMGVRDDTDDALTETRLAVVVRGAELTLRTVTSFVPVLRQHLEMGSGRVLVNLEHVKLVDVVGLAALLHATRYAGQHGSQLAVLPSIAVHQAALD